MFMLWQIILTSRCIVYVELAHHATNSIKTKKQNEQSTAE